MRPERRLSGRNGWGGFGRPVVKQPTGPLAEFPLAFIDSAIWCEKSGLI
jgi:hypothetical protein